MKGYPCKLKASVGNKRMSSKNGAPKSAESKNISYAVEIGITKKEHLNKIED